MTPIQDDLPRHKRRFCSIRSLLLCLAVFVPPSSSLAQYATSPADSDLRVQIQDLKNQLIRQNQRIDRLEGIIEPATAKSTGNAVTVPYAAWKNKGNWTRIQNGMSRDQVVAILGKPTSIKTDSIGYVTLIYKGDVSGAGNVSGNIGLDSNDRVISINAPVM